MSDDHPGSCRSAAQPVVGVGQPAGIPLAARDPRRHVVDGAPGVEAEVPSRAKWAWPTTTQWVKCRYRIQRVAWNGPVKQVSR